MWDYICSLCKHTVSSEFYWICRSLSAHLYVSRVEAWRLYTWRCQNKSLIINKINKLKLVFRELCLGEAGTLNPEPPHLTDVVFQCMISLVMFPNVVLTSGKGRAEVEASCGILVQPYSQSKCKWLQVMRKDSGGPFSIDILPLCYAIPLSLQALCPHSYVFGRLSGY